MEKGGVGCKMLKSMYIKYEYMFVENTYVCIFYINKKYGCNILVVNI